MMYVCECMMKGQRGREGEGEAHTQREGGLKSCLEQTTKPRTVYRELSRQPSGAEHRPPAWTQDLT